MYCSPLPLQYCLNISAPFIVEVPPFKKVMTDLLPYVDFLVRTLGMLRALDMLCCACCVRWGTCPCCALWPHALYLQRLGARCVGVLCKGNRGPWQVVLAVCWITRFLHHGRMQDPPNSPRLHKASGPIIIFVALLRCAACEWLGAEAPSCLAGAAVAVWERERGTCLCQERGVGH